MQEDYDKFATPGRRTHFAPASGLAVVALSCVLLAGCGPGGNPASTVAPVANRSPIANTDAMTQTGAALDIPVLANDLDPDGDPVTLKLVATPTNGSASIMDNGTPGDATDDYVRYVPAAGFHGVERFAYTIADGRGGEGTAAIELAERSSQPVAQPDSTSTPTGSPVAIPVLINDVDPNGLPLRLMNVSAPLHGTAVIDTNGTPLDGTDDFIVYTPVSAYSGTDSFSYTAGNGVDTVVGTVNVTIGTVAVRTISGHVMKGPVAGAVIELYRIDGRGNPLGNAVAQALTDAGGYWSVNVAMPREALLVTSTGGAYADETDNIGPATARRIIALGPNDRFEGVMPANDDYFALTLYTNALLLKSRNETIGNTFIATYADNRARAASAFGFDLLATAPANPLQPEPGASVEALKYAQLLGGAANVINDVSQRSNQARVAFNVLDAFIRDMSDCRLDGVDAFGPVRFLMLGVQRVMPVDLDLNLETLRFRNNNFSSYGNVLAQYDADACAPSGAAVDLLPPVITLLGGNPVVVEGGTGYTDAGATASDLRDGDLSGAIVVTNTVDASRVGSYTVTYTVADGAGNSASTTRTVNVVDTTAPVLTLLGSSPVLVLRGTPYVDAGASALDSLDGDLTGVIAIGNPVDTATPGSYTVTYNVTDAAGNAAVPITRTVDVIDTAAPVISLLGNNPATVEVGSVYVDAGATALDSQDGDVTASIVVTGSVDTAAPGSHVITYNVTDTDGNSAIAVTRIVNVVDTTPPVLALAGPDPLVLEAGGVYVEPGATASDNLDGDISASIMIDNTAVNPAVPGSYAVTYDVADAAGNSAVQRTRTVNVVDTTPPSITLAGANPQTLEANTAYVELGASATDTLDGDLTAAIVIDTTGVNPTALGSYSVTYDVSDAAGNAAVQVVRTVDVIDTTPPVITLTGANPQAIEAGSPYVELGASASDNLDGNLTASVVIDASAVDTATPGSYAVRYDVTDSEGNAAIQVVRTVNVVDTTAPVITLTGANPQTVEAGGAYVEFGASASDNLDGDLSASIAIDSSAVNTSVIGAYPVTYNVTDSQGNAAIQVTRTVNVVDTTAPVITLTGANPQTVEAGGAYVEFGASASDNLDGDLSASIAIDSSAVNTSVIGAYPVTYNVTDSQGNAAIQVTRTVNVVDTTAPVITLTGANPQTVEAGGAYVEFGASASDNLDGDLSASIAIDSSAVNTSVIGAYPVTYNVTDSQGNAATELIRTVNVTDTTPPVITLLGNNPDYVAIGSPSYTDPGASAADANEGDLSASVTTTGAVDTSTAGDYTLYYNVSDSSGNAAVTRTRLVRVLPADQATDSDGDGISDAIELEITGSATATQAQTFFIDPDPSITVRDGTSWATAFGDIEEVVVAGGGFVPPGVSAAQPTYIVLGDTSTQPATVADPDRWRLIYANGNCSHIAVIGSMSSGAFHPGLGQAEPSTVLNAPNNRILSVTNCTNLQFYNLQIVNSGGPGVATGGAMLVNTATGHVLDTVIFDGNQAGSSGGALQIGNSFSATVIRNSLFRNNIVQGGGALGGGGLYLANNGAVDISDTRFTDNAALNGSGGALRANENASVQITRTVLSGNESSGNGGAMAIERNNVSPSSVISHTLISGNNAGGEGGAIHVFCNEFSPALRFFNNLIVGNGALRGGGIAIDDCDATPYDNNTIAMNEARSAGGGGAMHIDTVSLAAGNFRPMPEVYDNVLFGNLDAGGASVYSINNLPSWSSQESHENLMDVTGSASTKDTGMTDMALEFDPGWYLLPTSQAVNLSQVNATNANKFLSTPERTTDPGGAADAGKADAGFHYAGPYIGPATLAVSDSRLQGNAGSLRQDLRVTLLNSSGDRLAMGNRVALEIAPGSAPVNLRIASAARYPADPLTSLVAADLANGDYKIEVDTNGVAGPDTVYLDIYVDGALINQVSIPVDP